jgi:beta-glucosidase
MDEVRLTACFVHMKVRHHNATIACGMTTLFAGMVTDSGYVLVARHTSYQERLMSFSRHLMIFFAFCGGALTLVGQTSKESSPIGDRSTELAAQVDQLVARMTLTEKVSQLVNDAPAIPRLGIPAFHYWSEGLHGVARKGYATNFPQAIGLGATWDASLMHQVGDVISTEGRAFHNAAAQPGYKGPSADLAYWSPNINIFRDPRWGRGQETYGEDPYLTARIGVEFIRGLQGDDPNFLKVVATPKHYVVHSGPEPLRHKFNVDVRPHDLEDTYMPAFRAAITEAHAGSIMCAYSAVDGVPACANKMILQGYLRNAWKFQGFVVSDCDAIGDIASDHHYASDAVHAAAVSVAAGTDLDCGRTYMELQQAVANHLVPESAIDTAVKNVFMMRLRMGQFARPGSDPYDSIAVSEIDSPEHRAVALQAARESIVLLKNENKTLPFKEDVHTIAVIGPVAEYLDAIQGNYAGTLQNPVYPIQGIEKEFAGRAKILYTQGASLASGTDTPLPSYTLSSADGKSGLTAEYFDDTTFSGRPASVRVDHHIDFDWRYASPVEGLGIQGYSIRWSGSFTPPAPGVYTFQANTHDCKGCKDHEQFKLVLDDKVVLDSSKYQTDTVGKTSENAKLTFTDVKPHSIRYEYVHRTQDSGTTLTWRAPEEILLAEAVKAAKQADAVVAFVGITQHQEGEGHDRTSIDLPESQEKMLEAVGATGKPLVIVLLNGSALAVNWAKEHAQAIVEAWYPGEAGGIAIAETLSGTNNPAGRLPVTFYSSLSQLPDFTDYTMANRTYRYFDGKPLYGFGYGLSYSTFTYSGLKLSASTLQAGQTLSVEADVKNDGDRDGDEVAELYLEAPKGPDNPKWSLEGFSRIHVPAHQSRRVSFELSPRQLSLVDAEGNRSVRQGAYSVVLGGGQPDGGLPTVAGNFKIIGNLSLTR